MKAIDYVIAVFFSVMLFLSVVAMTYGIVMDNHIAGLAGGGAMMFLMGISFIVVD